jgi:hypothetical protein
MGEVETDWYCSRKKVGFPNKKQGTLTINDKEYIFKS